MMVLYILSVVASFLLFICSLRLLNEDVTVGVFIVAILGALTPFINVAVSLAFFIVACFESDHKFITKKLF